MASFATATSPRVAVIGAGLAGISAAVTLADAGISVSLYEKTSRLGGRAGSTVLSDGTVLPMGSHLFLGCCDAYRKLLRTLGTSHLTYLQPRLRLAVAHTGRITRLWGAPLPHPLELGPAFLHYPLLAASDKLAVVRAAVAILSGVRAHPGETFAGWLTRQRQPLQARRMLWELISAPTLNAPAEEASAALALMVFRLAVFGRGNAASLGFHAANAAALVEPTGTYLECRGGTIHLETPVSHIAPMAEGTGLIINDKKGGRNEADIVIAAVPYTNLPKLLPTAWQEHPYFANLTYLPTRPIVDVFLTYRGLVAKESVIAIPGLPAVWIFPRPMSGSTQQLAVSISCPGALAEMTAEQVVVWTQAWLEKALACRLTDRLVDIRVVKNQRATFSAAPDVQCLRPQSVSPLPGLMLAGDYTDTGWPATMEGAVRSGVAAAQAAIDILRSR